MTDTRPELATVNLDFPFTRGDQTIDKVQVRRPRSGELRGLNIADLVQMNVAATAKLLPRITMPPLTDTEINNLDPADLTQFGMEIQDFLLPKAAKEQGSQD
ncbi:tail assembly chaperone E/41/14-like protein [Sphingomonas sp. PP-F2F-A104-K0414]|uniref:phage tail assembly protein n=1 Tax=Sphingomonas sp. PP-F2F-A104-K0414 TaxID=2135661 RepID=UPI00104BA744|nr:phage tail assembly protein [Sphingomonas sp. PP-F2F-A104-K0414]TCP99869.1 tail assembly chaperone E/41/14-like protein [Sphingomonas sp. PP-F2F-A104-K0414]